MNALITILFLILTSLLGLAFIELLSLIKSKDLMLKYAVGFGLGVGILCSFLLIISLLKLRWNLYLLVTPFIFIPFYLFNYIKINRPTFKHINDKFNLIIIFHIILLVLFVFFQSQIRPLTSWDGWASWQMRSKVFFHEEASAIAYPSYISSEYPLLVPVYSVYIYKILGIIDDTSILLVSFYVYAMIGLLIYAFLRKKTSFRYASLITFLILSTQNLIRHGGRYEAGMADIIVAYFLLAAIILYVLSVGSKVKIALLFIFLAFLSQIKNEGILLSFTFFLLVAGELFRNKKYSSLKSTLWYVLPFVGWIGYKFLFNFPPGILFNRFVFEIKMLVDIITAQISELFSIKNWNFGWYFFIATLPRIFRLKQLFIPLCVIIFQIFVYVFLFFFSNSDPVIHAQGIYDRLLLQLYPSSILLSSICFYGIIWNNKYLKKLFKNR